jgi:hypothetical protein
MNRAARLPSSSAGRSKKPPGDGPPSRPACTPNMYPSTNPVRRGCRPTQRGGAADQPCEAGLPTNPTRRGCRPTCPPSNPARRSCRLTCLSSNPAKRGCRPTGPPGNPTTQQSALRKSRPSTIKPHQHDGTSPSDTQTVEAVRSLSSTTSDTYPC